MAGVGPVLDYNVKAPISEDRSGKGYITRSFYYWLQAIQEAIVNVLPSGGPNQVLVTDGSSTPQWSSTLPAVNGHAVTNLDADNLVDVPAQRLLGRADPGTGAVQMILIGTNLSLDAATDTLNATGGGGFEDGYWSPLTDGDLIEAELIFANGDTIAVWTPTP